MSILSLYLDFDFSPPLVVMVDEDPEYGRVETLLGPARSWVTEDRIPEGLMSQYLRLIQEHKEQLDQDAWEHLEREYHYRSMVF